MNEIDELLSLDADVQIITDGEYIVDGKTSCKYGEHIAPDFDCGVWGFLGCVCGFAKNEERLEAELLLHKNSDWRGNWKNECTSTTVKRGIVIDAATLSAAAEAQLNCEEELACWLCVTTTPQQDSRALHGRVYGRLALLREEPFCGACRSRLYTFFPQPNSLNLIQEL